MTKYILKAGNMLPPILVDLPPILMVDTIIVELCLETTLQIVSWSYIKDQSSEIKTDILRSDFLMACL